MTEQEERLIVLLKKIYGEENVGFKQISEIDKRGIWVKGLSHYPIGIETVLFDKKFICDMDEWLTRNYVIYSSPQASQTEWRLSFQRFPPGKDKRSYFDLKHDGKYDSIMRAKFEATLRLANMEPPPE